MTDLNRTIVVMNAIGWQGGTVHQLCATLGLDFIDFLSASPQDVEDISSSYSMGWFASRTSPGYMKSDAISRWHGNLNFWLGVYAGHLANIKSLDAKPKAA